MEIKDLFGKALTNVRETYRAGAEHINLEFTDLTTGEKFSISFTAERGSDLLTTIKRKK